MNLAKEIFIFVFDEQRYDHHIEQKHFPGANRKKITPSGTRQGYSGEKALG